MVNSDINMEQFHLQTTRFKIRPFLKTDVAFMMELSSDPEVIRYTGDSSFQNEEEAHTVIASLIAQFQQKRMGRFVVLDRQTEEKLGWCGLKWLENVGAVDLGYRFFRRHWGKGIATETSLACLDYGFNVLGLPEIIAYADLQNGGSVRVLEKMGFKSTGPAIYPGLNAEGFLLLRDDFNLSHSPKLE
jgi:ribosomal-protein-alanine N-acetyltransferase